MKKLLFTLLILTISCNLFAQNPNKKNQIYLELGGNSLFTGINYERQFTKKPGLMAYVGAGIYGVDPAHLTIPLGLRYLIKLRAETSYIEFGAGATYTAADVKVFVIVDRTYDTESSRWNFVPSIAYRGITESNFVFRVGLTPILNEYSFIPFAGFSVGKRF